MSDFVNKFLDVKYIKKEKRRTTFNMTTEYYDDLKIFCSFRGIIISDLLDLLIKDFVIKHSEDIKKYKGSKQND